MHDLCFAMFSAVFGYAVLVSVLSSGVNHDAFRIHLFCPGFIASYNWYDH